MAGRHTLLTAEIQEQILACIRAGAWDHVAAESAGIDRSTFYRWLQRGARDRRGPYREFCRAVRQARAQARLTAEVEVKKLKPDLWLTKGPGRDREGAPGWTDRLEVVGNPDEPIVFTFNIEKASGHPNLPLGRNRLGRERQLDGDEGGGGTQ